MTPEKFQILMGLFQEALAVEGEARARLIRDGCAGDPELREELEGMLGSDSGPRLATAAGLEAVRRNVESDESEAAALWTEGPPPVLSGNYRVLRVLGEGGMGIVYQAEQAFPRRMVALKAMRPGSASRAMLRRFHNEAQILARLEHVGIARIYEAGAADELNPDQAFFAMEFVDGRPLTEYAEAHHLGVEDRLRLMVKVCEAVQHAHQRGVIHRDLKPSNILVATGAHAGDYPAGGDRETVPQPKVLDFGVARAVHGDAPMHTMDTGAGQLVGTLPYMSPEQVMGNTDAVDTRSDVYALGVILFQLLAGKLPYELDGKALMESARIIKEQPPTRLGTLDRTLRGDLETIVAKALEKERERRYQSAAEFGEDLRRFLVGEPIVARRDALMYVLNVRMRRFRGLVIAGTAVIVLFAALAAYAAVQARAKGRLAERVTEELVASEVGRGRMMVAAGNPVQAEKLLWDELLKHPTSREAKWALRELYSRRPIVDSMAGLAGPPIHVSADATGDLLALTGYGGASCWRWPTRERLWESSFGGNHVPIVAVSADGTRMALGLENGVLRVVSGISGATVCDLKVASFAVRRVVLSADGSRAACSLFSGELIMVDVGECRFAWKSIGARGTADEIDISPDGSTIVTGGHETRIRIWSASDLRKSGEIADLGARCVGLKLVDDGRRLLVATDDRRLRLFRLPLSGESAVCEHTATTAATTVDSVSVSPDGTTMALGGGGTLEVWRLPDLTLESRLAEADGSRYLCVLRSKDELLTVGSGLTLRRWETAPEKWRRVLVANGGAWLWGLSLGRGSGMVASYGQDHVIHVFDNGRDEEVVSAPMPEAGSYGTVCFITTRNASSRLLAPLAGGRLGTLDPRTLTLAQQFQVDDAELTAITVSDDQSLLATCSAKGRIRVWKVDDSGGLALLTEGRHGTSRIRSASFSPDSKMLAITGDAPAATVWRTATMDKAWERSSRTPGTDAVFSRDSKVLILGMLTPNIELLETEHFTTVGRLAGHMEGVLSVALAPNGRTLASGGVDGSIRLWDLPTRRELAVLGSEPGQVSRLAFSEDTRWLYSGHQGGRIYRWDLGYYDRHIAGNLDHQFARATREGVAGIDEPNVRALLGEGKDDGRKR